MDDSLNLNQQKSKNDIYKKYIRDRLEFIQTIDNFNNWHTFREEYNLKNSRYVKDVFLLQELQNDTRYPIILYPNLLIEQFSKKFEINYYKNKNYITLHDFLDVAKLLKLEGDDWTYLVSPRYPIYPSTPNIPTEITETVKDNGANIVITVFSLLLLIPILFLFGESPELAVGLLILLVVYYIVMNTLNDSYFGNETKTRTRKLKKKEIEQLERESRERFQKEVDVYNERAKKYDEQKRNYIQRLNSQSALLDKYANSIVPNIFIDCLLKSIKMEDCDTPPQRGMSENKMFYELMKEIPSYVKVDKLFGSYFPDLVIHNGCSCPIDIEIDEPYEYKTKKEIHYVGCADEDRNKYFISNNWFVIRFTENQIKNHLAECVDIVKAFVHFIDYGDTTKLYEVKNTIKLIQEPRWTKEEARMMAIDNYRSK